MSQGAALRVVSWGITTSRAHLDRLDGSVYPRDAAETSGEIDWLVLWQWLADTDPSTSLADFAGRYFLGSPTDAEVDAGDGFCLWAHGEGSDQNAPWQIVPLQRADSVRQGTAGADGRFFGFQDATALVQHLDRCLAVGDLEIAGTKQILVFLEVDDGTPLSVDYWASWATTVHDAVLAPARLADRTGAESMQPLVPAVLCAFAFDGETEKFVPEPGVRACLDQVGPPGYRTHCHGLWARPRRDDPDLDEHTFLWSNIGEYRQPRLILGLEGAYMQRVPVRYLRWFDGPEGLPIPEGPLRDTLSLLTIDWPAEDGDNPVSASFTATDWRANRREGGRLVDLPSQYGIDTGARVTSAAAACLPGAQITVSLLPYWSNSTPVALHGPCELAIRYYRPSGGRALNVAESEALSGSGIQVAACYQHTAPLDQGWVPYVNALIAPFLNGEGRDDGENAFEYAADTIGQPPYTPVYFSIDFPVDTLYKAPKGLTGEVQTPPLATFLDYFADVRRGYRDFLTTHPETPYYIGVYCWPETAAALYRAGLATHFWQPPWAKRLLASPFPHVNVWQVGMFSTPQVVADNAAVQACAPPGTTQPNRIWVDIDVAWGDPGGFVVR